MIIRLDGYTFRVREGRRKYIHLIVQGEGGLWEIVPTGCQTVDEALKPEVLRRCGAEAFAHAVLPTVLSAAQLPPPRALAPEGSFVRGMLETCRTLEGGGWSTSRKEDNRLGGRYVLVHLGSDALLPESQITLQRLTKVREALEADAKKTKSKFHYRYIMRYLLEEMHKRRHLLRECLTVFDGMDVSSSPHRKCGLPYSDDDVRKLLAAEPDAPFLISVPLWNGLSGGPQAFDAFTQMCAEVAPEAGRVCFERQKTEGRAEYFLVRQGRGRIASRPFKDGQPYVIEEGPLNPGCALDLTDDKTIKRIRSWFEYRWKIFTKKAGVTGDGKSFKSLRQHFTSHLISELVPDRVIARTMGIKVGAIRRYDFVLERDLEIHRDLRERHLEAIASGRTGEYVLTDKQLLETAEGFLAKSFEEFAAQFAARYTETLAELTAAEQTLLAAGNGVGGEQAHEMLFTSLERLLDHLDQLLGGMDAKSRHAHARRRKSGVGRSY